MDCLISVVIPTVRGREDHLARCYDAYGARSSHRIEIIVVTDAPWVGRAWNEGAQRCKGTYLHFTADDLEPHEGWDTQVTDGRVPAAALFEPSGGLSERQGDAENVLVPFCSRKQWGQIGPFLDCHYFTDDFFTYRALKLGFGIVKMPNYAFTHHWAQPGRGAGMTEGERMLHDQAIFSAAIANSA